MRKLDDMVSGVKVATWGLAALAAASASYWGLKMGERHAVGPAVPVAGPSGPPLPNPQDVARALGGGVVAKATSQEPVPSGSRLVLLGVVADAAHGGAALIAVDGKPARPFKVGTSVDGHWMLQSAAGRKAVLAADTGAPRELTLVLPPVSP